MTARHLTPPSEHSAHSDSNMRKRVGKACDRCRLKKSKCDGANPCERCRADNTICVFGTRKKAHDKVYPKGYVQMLEQQHAWLVNGLQELYRRANEGKGWPGEPLKTEPNGHPLTHNLLTQLGVLDHTKGEKFVENMEAMQQEPSRQNGCPNGPNLPIVNNTSSPFQDAFARRRLLSTPSSYSLLVQAQHMSIKPQPSAMSAFSNPPYSAAMRMPSHVDLVTLYGETRTQNAFNPFDDAEMIGSESMTLSLDDRAQASRHMSLNCLPSTVLFDPNDAIDQFFNANM